MSDTSQERFAADVRRWLVDADWVEKEFGITRSTVWDWVRAGTIPRPVAVLGGARLWDVRQFTNVTRPKLGPPFKNESSATNPAD